MATRLDGPVVDVATRSRPPSGRAPVEERATEPARDRRDLCTARPGSYAERVGDGLGALPSVCAGAAIVAVGYVVLAALAIGFGVLLTEVILPGSVQRWDTDAVRALVDGRPQLDTASSVGSYLGEFATVLVVGGILLAVCVWRHWYRLAALFTIAICLEGAVYATTTYFVTRTRPAVPRLEHLVVSDSYPSGHVAAAVVLWFSLALLVWTATTSRPLRAVAVIAAVLAPVVVALSRMYRGMHHPTDAAAGYVIGWGCVLIALTTVRAVGRVSERRRARSGETS